MSCRERSRLKDLLPISTQRHLAQDTQLGGSGNGTSRGRPSRAGNRIAAKSLKPTGLALRQGQWRPTLGVEKVRARRREPGHQDATQAQRVRRREMFPQDEVWSRRLLFDAHESAVGYGRLSIEPREPMLCRLHLKKGEALGAAATGQRSTSKKMASEQEDGEISADASPLRRPQRTM